MSRGFDGFDIDDFRDPQWESERYRAGRASSQGRGSGSQSGATARSKLEKLREAESIGDQVAAQSRGHPVAGRAPVPRETKQTALLAERDRTNYMERDRGYSLRRSEIHTLTEVGKFRVVDVEDLAKFAYSGDHSRMGSDLRSLSHQGLVGVLVSALFSERKPRRPKRTNKMRRQRAERMHAGKTHYGRERPHFGRPSAGQRSLGSLPAVTEERWRCFARVHTEKQANLNAGKKGF